MNERDVRRVAGWVGVGLSRSRVRTEGKPGYGLYRVRGSVARDCGCDHGRGEHVWEPGGWTPYLFTLEQIEMQVILSIQAGTPSRPGELNLYDPTMPGAVWMIPVRWTDRYRGRRDLGMGGSEREVGTVVAGADPLLDASSALGTTVRQRRREANAEFQRGHLERRGHGLRARHEAKLGRASSQIPASDPPHSNDTGLVTPCG